MRNPKAASSGLFGILFVGALFVVLIGSATQTTVGQTPAIIVIASK